jgi:hypothetical protein
MVRLPWQINFLLQFLLIFCLDHLLNVIYNQLILLLHVVVKLFEGFGLSINLIDSLILSQFHVGYPFLYPAVPVHFVSYIERNTPRLKSYHRIWVYARSRKHIKIKWIGVRFSILKHEKSYANLHNVTLSGHSWHLYYPNTYFLVLFLRKKLRFIPLIIVKF